jgi:hypothetical protein
MPVQLNGVDYNRVLFSIDYWSLPQITVVIPAAPASQALTDVVVDTLPAGCTVVKVCAMFKFRCIQNAGAVNMLDGAQHIQVRTDAPGAFGDGISLVTDQFTIAAAAVDAPGDVLIGDHNLVATVFVNDTYNFQWTDAHADVAGLTFTDLQTGLRIYYRI